MSISDGPEVDAHCPVSLETLNELRVLEPAEVVDSVRDFNEEKRIRLALYCYNRSHLRQLGLTVASIIEPARLALFAGTLGEVLAAQCRAAGLSFGIETVAMAKPARGKVKISLGGRG